MMEKKVTYTIASDAAKQLRKHLRQTFDHAFSVRVKQSGPFELLVVTWTDGPFYESVKQVAGYYCRRDTDGNQLYNKMADGVTYEVYLVESVSLEHKFSTPEKQREAIERVYR